MSEHENPSGWRRAFAEFERLLELDPRAREQAIDALRGDDAALWAQVHTLLRADALAESQAFLGQAPLDSDSVAMPAAVQPGVTLGAYRIESRLGEGGMGEVWLARRADGLFEAPVALKLLHAHLGHSAVRERFLREGRILGELAHGHVARLLDAGVFADGQLYLAIEYIEGDRIDRWCDTQRLDINARIRLFLQVCAAISHAHAHLVVHRDLKPSNILVTAAGEVKLLDFGIAKLVEDETGTGNETELTRLGGRALTPEYAAPEQIAGGTISVATDIYSLGVLLYLLLSGRRPYGASGDTLSQIERQVLETEPAPMSHWRLSGKGEAAAQITQIAEHRNSQPRRLRDSLRGDLDLIVGKALKKLPTDRYPSVDALADDLRRHLDHLPVLAQRDSLAYRARKFVRRHRVAVAASAVVAIAVVAGIAGTLSQAQRARDEAHRADAQAVRAEHEAAEARAQTERVRSTKAFFVSIFQNADPMRSKDGSPLTVSAALDDAIRSVDTDLGGDPRLQADLLNDLGEIKANGGHLKEAQQMFARALPLQEKVLAADDPAVANTLVNLGVIGQYLSEPLSARRQYMERAVAIFEKHADSEGDNLANARNGLGAIYIDQGDADAGRVLMEKSLDWYRQKPDENARLLGVTLGNLGMLAYRGHRYDDAKRYLDECLSVLEKALGPHSAGLNDCLVTMAQIADAQNDQAAFVHYAERTEEVTRAFSGDHPFRARALGVLGEARREQGRDTEAESLLRQALAMYERLGLAHDLSTSTSLARLRDQAHDYPEVIRLADGALGRCAPDSPLIDCKSLISLREKALAALGRRN